MLEIRMYYVVGHGALVWALVCVVAAMTWQRETHRKKVRNVQAWFFEVVFNIKPLWDWMSSVVKTILGLSVQGGNIVKTIWTCPGFVEQKQGQDHMVFTIFPPWTLNPRMVFTLFSR